MNIPRVAWSQVLARLQERRATRRAFRPKVGEFLRWRRVRAHHRRAKRIGFRRSPNRWPTVFLPF